MTGFGLLPTISVPSSGKFQLFLSPKRLHHHRNGGRRCSLRNKASTSSCSSSSSITEYDLYELLGVDSSSDRTQIKNAYRSLQKRCHPDIAGPMGHDMAIILNDAYSVLSDPISRSAYDEEQAKFTEFHGYTGRPLYSTWLGSENEHRAVFVDEVKCVGCLKCALFASNTFAVENVYGRARVVAQWADPEDRIVDAIDTCPVDCISFVERSDLAALEFLMSKQPRGNVRLSSGNTCGARVSNIFVDIEKFQKRYQETKAKATGKNSKEPDLQREARTKAVRGIRAMANWFYWRTPASAARTTEHCKALVTATTKPTREQQDPNFERLRQTAAERRAGGNRRAAGHSYEDEYWTPTLVLPESIRISSSEETTSILPSNFKEARESNVDEENKVAVIDTKEERSTSTAIPEVIAAVAMIVVGYGGGDPAGVGLKEHIAGDVVVNIVNSSEIRIVLTGITWYAIGAGVVGLVRLLASRKG